MRNIRQKPLLKASWSAVQPGGRLDAICYIGGDTWICGGREVDGNTASKGKVYRTTDAGKTWTQIATLSGAPDINAMEYAGGGVVYALSGSNGSLYRSLDYGQTWGAPVVVSSSTPEAGIYIISYGLWVMPSGTVLVTDTRDGGGRVYRSTNQGVSFSMVATLGVRALYRIMGTQDGAILDTFGGQIYKTVDDGQTWTLKASLTADPVYAIAHLGGGVMVVADAAGVMYRSTDSGNTWETVGTYDGAADDIANMGNGFAVYATYTSQMLLYLTTNYGKTWEVFGPSSPDGWNIDRMAARPDGKVIGTTLRGLAIAIDRLAS